MLLREIERHLRKTGTPPSVFGRRTMNDPGFVRELRAGREPRERTMARIRAFLEATR